MPASRLHLDSGCPNMLLQAGVLRRNSARGLVAAEILPLFHPFSTIEKGACAAVKLNILRRLHFPPHHENNGGGGGGGARGGRRGRAAARHAAGRTAPDDSPDNECTICANTFAVAGKTALLRCGQTFCWLCLQRPASSSGADAVLRCPRARGRRRPPSTARIAPWRSHCCRRTRSWRRG